MDSPSKIYTYLKVAVRAATATGDRGSRPRSVALYGRLLPRCLRSRVSVSSVAVAARIGPLSTKPR